MTNALTTFTFAPANAQVRIVTIDENPWFVATDVCRALSLDVSKGASKYMQALGSDERRMLTPDQFGGKRGTAGGLLAMSESGLYRLIMRSDKPEARFFS